MNVSMCPLFGRVLGGLLAIAVASVGGDRPTVGQESEPHRLLFEAERFTVDDGGWQAIAVGRGNYFVDSIGAGHFSGGRLLHLPADERAAAHVETIIPVSGRYRVWARYEYPWRQVDVSFRIVIEQAGEPVFEAVFGRQDAVRTWFFNLPDAPWNDLPHGVEGPVSEVRDARLEAGPATIRLLSEPQAGLAADRNVDFVFVTSDLRDEFRGRGERLYPILDEISRAVERRTFVRITNPAEASAPVTVDAQYTLNRAPWQSPAIRIGADSAGRGARPTAIEPGSLSPWVNLSCQDTTHACHLWIRPIGDDGPARLVLEVAAQPTDDAVLRRVEVEASGSDGAVVSIPPYPDLEPERILTGEETIQRILDGLTGEPPPGWPPRRFPVYAGLGGNADRRIDRPDRLHELLRRLFLTLGPNAFNSTSVSALPPGLGVLRADGREPPRLFTYGDYRWFPTDERVDRALRDLEAAGARDQLRGFTYGDEIKLSDWYPRGAEGEAAFRQAMATLGESPASLLWPDGDSASWEDVRLDGSVEAAARHPRLFVRTQQFQNQYVLSQFGKAARRLQGVFGPDVLIGANFSPHPSFRPDATAFVRLFRSGAFNRATHDDYWWQASEMGPESTGFLLDAFRAGLDGRPGVIQPYVMPHAPGNSDRGFLLGLWTAITHGATAMDIFHVGPEQLNTENYISADAIERFRAVRAGVYALGPVEDVILHGSRRPTRVGLVLADSTDRWENVTPAIGARLPPDTKLTAQASNTERKGIWQALRHAHIPVDMVLEEDLANGRVDRYRTLYLAGPQLDGAAAMGLASWVERGGTLVAVAGAASRDEFDQASSALDTVFGVTNRTTDVYETFLRPRVEVPRLGALDHVQYAHDGPMVSFDAVAWQERLTPGLDTAVLGRFTDGSPAVTVHPHGAGQAVLVGTLPGTAYLRSGAPAPAPLPDRGPFMHQALTAYGGSLRQLISGWAADSAPGWPRLSQPFVEAGLIETSKRVLVPLANFGDPGVQLSLSVPQVGPATRVWTIQHGDVPFVQRGDEIDVTMWMELVDYLVIER